MRLHSLSLLFAGRNELTTVPTIRQKPSRCGFHCTSANADATKRRFELLKKARYLAIGEKKQVQYNYEYDDKNTPVPDWVKKAIFTLRDAVKNGTFEEKLKELKVKRKLRPSNIILAGLLVEIADVATFKRVEKALGVNATHRNRHELFMHFSQKYSLNQLVELYAEAKREGVVLDWAVMLPLMRIVKHSRRAVEKNTIADTLVRLYKETKATDEAREKENFPSRSTDPELSDYFHRCMTVTLNALSTSPHKERHYKIAKELLDDARKMGLILNDSTSSLLTTLFMQNSPTYEDALKAYYECYEVFKKQYSDRSYSAILHVYCNMEIDDPKASHPQVRGYFEILEHMKAAGHEMKMIHYSHLLRLYKRIATTTATVVDETKRKELQARLVEVLDRTYKQLMGSSSLQPGASIIAQFLDVYSRLDNFDGVARMWSNIIMSDVAMTYDAVSVIFDACGHHGALEYAMDVRAKIDRDKFEMNLNNWASWLECLCRLGKLDQAVEEYLNKTPRDEDGIPDRVCFMVILSIANKFHRLHEIRERIAKKFPTVVKVHPGDAPFIVDILNAKPPQKRVETRKETEAAKVGLFTIFTAV